MDVPEEVFLRDDSDDEDDIDLEFTSDSDSRHQRYVRSDIVAARITAERERADALEAHVEQIKGAWPYKTITRPQDVLRKMQTVLDSGPEPSLAQLKAKVAAETLQAEIENVDYGAFARERLKVAFEFYQKRADEIAAGGGHES